MPTAAKLVAAVLFAATGWATAMLASPHVAPFVTVDRAVLVTLLVAGYCGWSLVGPTVGRGYDLAVTTGLRAAMAAMVMCLAGYAAITAIHLAMRPPFYGLSDSTVNFLRAFLTLGGQLIYAEVLLPMVVGAALSGAVAEYVGRRWT